ncbi:MAG: HAMP domain-containing protein [Lachnospiraceae bacterium]|nr:HAMP domain-containing protein [Lachnospiraceae bacterium]
MKHSLRVKLTLILVGLLVLLISAYLLVNIFFLEAYYQKVKKGSLSRCYDELAETVEAVGDDYTDEETSNRIESVETAYGLNIYLISEGSDDYGPFIRFLYPSSTYLKDARTKRYERVKDALFLYIFAGLGLENNDQIELLDSREGSFDIYKMYENSNRAYYMDLLGYLKDGTMVFIRANYDSIQESASISNKFMSIVGIFIVAFGAVAMYILSRSFARPIRDMSEIAGRMSELDFEQKYTGGRKDEIGELGSSINMLSKRLEQTIIELKTANNELQKDNEKMTRIDEMRTEFLSNVSHELKTPIALIQGYAEGLKEIAEDPESRDYYCDVIIDEALKMNSMVKKLLTLNQIEFGRNDMSMERFDIVALVNSVIASTDIIAKQKDIEVRVEDREPVYVWADQFRIEEVVTNYVSNAMNHIDGERIIEVSFTVSSDIVRVSVFNTGEQIPEEEMDRIWDKFYKVDKARTREYGGSGIGLSIVKAVMDSHNRLCGAINHVNGVEFWFELDCGKGDSFCE